MKKWKEQVDSTVEYLAQRYEKIVIAAHSMGTLFSVNEGIKYRDKVKALFLLSIPLEIGVKPVAIKNSLKLIFDKEENFDEITMAMKKGCSIDLDRRMWNYIGWVPRYAELLVEVAKTKEILPMLDIPTYIFMSRHDELVSVKSDKYFNTNPEITYFLLEESCHFYYSPHDMELLMREFQGLIEKLR
jgi:esterase/lipase